MKNYYHYIFCLLIGFTSCKKNNNTDNVIITKNTTGTPAKDTFKITGGTTFADTITVFNNGVPGNTASDLLNRINTVIKEKPNLTIIMIGTNDVSISVQTFPTFQANLSKIIDSLKASGSSVMLLTPPPISPNCTYINQFHLLDSACSIIKSLSITKTCYYVDIHTDIAQLIAQPAMPLLYLADGVHPNQAGYVDIAGFIYTYLRSNAIKKTRIACFGDSITNGYLLTGAGTTSGFTYPADLKKSLDML